MAGSSGGQSGVTRGYPLEIMGGEVETKYRCSSCRLLLRDPIQSFCGHRFCKLCIEDLTRENNEAKCPSCIEEDMESEFSVLRLDQTFPDNAIKREFLNLPVQCVFVWMDERCTWHGKFREYELHVKDCELRPVTCVCELQVAHKYLSNHQAQDCSQRHVKCPCCQQDVVYQNMQLHYQECPKYPTRCPQCNEEIVQEKLASHQNPETGDCKNLAILCPYGCGLNIERSQMSQHLQQNAPEHFQKLAERAANADLQIHSLLDKLNVTHLAVNEVKELQATGGASAVQSGDLSNINSKFGIVELRLGTFENVVTVLNREIERQATITEEASRQRQADRSAIENLEAKVKNLERMLAHKDVALAEQDLRVSALEQTGTDGTLVWKISDISRKRQEAIAGKVTSLYSPAFYTSKHGYKMCARIYLNGDGMGKGSHISLFFVVMRSPYDALLRWPFRQKVTLMLLDQNQRDHVVEAFRPDPSSSSFKRPTSDMNIASGCPLFMPLSQLDSQSHAYVKEDSIFIKVVVDCSDLK